MIMRWWCVHYDLQLRWSANPGKKARRIDCRLQSHSGAHWYSGLITQCDIFVSRVSTSRGEWVRVFWVLWFGIRDILKPVSFTARVVICLWKERCPIISLHCTCKYSTPNTFLGQQVGSASCEWFSLNDPKPKVYRNITYSKTSNSPSPCSINWNTMDRGYSAPRYWSTTWSRRWRGVRYFSIFSTPRVLQWPRCKILPSTTTTTPRP